MNLESDKRMSVEELEKILNEVPLDIKGKFPKLNGRMGLGKIIYINPSVGVIDEIKVKGDIVVDMRRSDETYLTLKYKENILKIRYR